MFSSMIRLQPQIFLCVFILFGEYFLVGNNSNVSFLLTDDEPIVVPKSGRSTRVPVSSVLI